MFTTHIVCKYDPLHKFPCVKRDVIITELAHHVGVTNIAEKILTWLCRTRTTDLSLAG